MRNNLVHSFDMVVSTAFEVQLYLLAIVHIYGMVRDKKFNTYHT